MASTRLAALGSPRSAGPAVSSRVSQSGGGGRGCFNFDRANLPGANPQSAAPLGEKLREILLA